jgi:hypothetical protein
METTIQLLTERQAAKLLAVSCAVLRKWRRAGEPPQFVKCGRCVRYDLRSLESFVNENSSSKKIAADRESAAKREVRVGYAIAQL